MYNIAIPASFMALIFLAILYILFTMGLRENLSPQESDPRTLKPNCTIDGRVMAMAMAWNDTIQSPQKIDMDTNVYYKLWSSNVLRRGLDKIYTNPDLFTKMMDFSKNGILTPANLREVMAPYYQRETAPPKVVMPLQPFCHNP